MKRAQGAGLRAQGTGHRAQGSGRRAQDAGLRAQGTERRAQGAERRAQGTGLRAQGTERRAQDAGLRAQGTERRAQGTELRAQSTGRSKLFPLLVWCAAVIFFSGCSKDDFPLTDNKDVVGEIQLNTLFDIKEISDGLIVTGVNDSKIKISKLDVNFNTVWSKNDFDWGNNFSEGGWGGTFYSADIINVIEKENGNIICFCSIMEGTDVISNSALIVVLDRSGKEIYRKELENYVLINSVMTSDSGFLLFGSSLIRLYSGFSKAMENDDHNYVFSGANVIQTDDNGIAVTGTWNSDQVFLRELNENGSIRWEKRNYNSQAFNDLGYDLHQLSDEGFIIIGRTRNNNEPWDMNCLLIRTESSGDTIWTRKYGEGSDEWFEEIIYASDDEFVIRETVGFPNAPDHKSILLRITGNGDITGSREIPVNELYLYTESGYLIRVKKTGDHIFSLSKLQVQNLFDN